MPAPSGRPIGRGQTKKAAKKRPVAAAARALTKRQAPSKDVTAFIELARRRWRTASEAESTTRALMLEDRRFKASDQWPEKTKADRDRDGRPCLTINRIPGFIQQVTNQFRNHRPSIVVDPVEDADQEAAETFQGLIRHIEQNSDADIAYETAVEHMVEMGRGYWRILTEFADDESFNQEIRIKRIRNPFTVYFDPACREFDYSDARYAFIVEDMPREEYDRLYGETSPAASLEDFKSIGDDTINDWTPEGKMRVAEYFFIDYTRVTLVQMADGSAQVVDADLIPALKAKGKARRQRIVNVPTVKWAKINAVAILEGDDKKEDGQAFPSKFIPIVPCIGNEMDMGDGTIDIRGMVRDLISAQQMINFWQSAITEAIALAPKAPFIIAAGQIDPAFAHLWDTANQQSHVYLPYTPVEASNGTLAPAPHREAIEPAIQAMVLANQQAENNLRAIAGFYSVEQNERKIEQSGRAILARQEQGELGNSHYLSNAARAVRHTGRILVDMIPRVYDAPQVKRINGEDGEARTVLIHGADKAPNENMEIPKNTHSVLDLSMGTFDVRVSSGPSYATKRKEAVDGLMELAKAAPQIAMAGADIIVENMDFHGAQKLAKRLKKLNPAAQGEDEDGKQPLPPEVQQQMQQAQMVIDELTKQLNAAKDALANDTVKAAATERIAASNNESKERIAALNAQLDVLKIKAQVMLAQLSAQSASAVIDQKAQHEKDKLTLQGDEQRRTLGVQATHAERQTVLQGDVDQLQTEIQTFLDQTHETKLLETESANAKEAQAADQQHEQAMGQQDAAAQSDLAAQQHDQTLEQGDAGHAQALEQQQQAAKLAPKPAAGAK